MDDPRTRRAVEWRDRTAVIVLWATAIVVAGFFGWILFDLVRGGARQLSAAFFVESPSDFGRGGGIAPILVSTFWIIALCLIVALPVSLGCAIYLAEFSDHHSGFGRWTRRCLDALAAVPSIVFGLFGSALFCVYLGMGFSILSGALTLACMVLPILTRTLEDGIRAVSLADRHGAAALGFSRTSTIIKVVLPGATPALIAGVVLSIGRAMAETAALIFTSGDVDRMPTSLGDSGRALSVHIYDLAMNIPGGNANAYASGLILVIALLVTNGIVGWLFERWIGRGRLA